MSGAALNRLTLTAKPRVKLQNSSDNSAILSIKNVSGVTVEEFDFDLEGMDKHGTLVSGTAENIAPKDCTFSQTANDSRPSLLAISAHVNESTSVIRIPKYRFDSRGGAMCQSVDANEQIAPSLICERCRCSSPFTQVCATQPCHRLRLADNVFMGEGERV